MSVVRRLALMAVLVYSALAVNAMDNVTLTNGKVLVGEIISKDDDGSVLMNLTDGTKRYVMSDEIASMSNDGAPFKYTKGAIGIESGSRERKPSIITVYGGYEHLMPTSVRMNRLKLKLLDSSPSIVIGAVGKIRFLKTFVFMPGIELTYSQRKYNEKAGEGTERMEFYTASTLKNWYASLRIPLLVGYELKINEMVGCSFYTGPVADLFIASKHYGNLEFDTDQVYFYNDSFDGAMEYNRFNLDWRLGFRFNYDMVSVGLAYTIGMTNRVKLPDGLSYSEKTKVSMRQNSLQVTIGVNI